MNSSSPPTYPALRADYAHPLHPDAGSGCFAQASYATHVNDLLVQLLLTAPGERVNLPTFGCGLRQLLFAGQSDALVANVGIQVRQSVQAWLSDQVNLTDVSVVAGATAPAGSGLDQGQLLVTVSYTLVETQTPAQVSVTVS
jgi:phage baseplate assembly protein W